MPLHIFHSSGGVIYHLRALRYRKLLWKSFSSSLRDWVGAWSEKLDKNETIYLVGPSAGHCFPFEILKEFRSVVLVEPDPIAAAWFIYRAKKLKISADFKWIPAYWPKLKLPVSSNAPVIFCNLLGQILNLKKHSFEFKQWTQGRPWLSYHDRFSGLLKPVVTKLSSLGRMSDQQLLAEIYPDKAGELEPHVDFVLNEGSDLDHHYFAWEIKPGVWHLIEGVSQS